MSGQFPLQQLRRLLTADATLRGRVTRISGQRAEVATRDGLRQVMMGATLTVGQAVTIRNGIAWPVAEAGRRYAV
jgi:hypothetical protein